MPKNRRAHMKNILRLTYLTLFLFAFSGVYAADEKEYFLNVNVKIYNRDGRPWTVKNHGSQKKVVYDVTQGGEVLYFGGFQIESQELPLLRVKQGKDLIVTFYYGNKLSIVKKYQTAVNVESKSQLSKQTYTTLDLAIYDYGWSKHKCHGIQSDVFYSGGDSKRTKAQRGPAERLVRNRSVAAKYYNRTREQTHHATLTVFAKSKKDKADDSDKKKQHSDSKK